MAIRELTLNDLSLNEVELVSGGMGALERALLAYEGFKIVVDGVQYAGEAISRWYSNAQINSYVDQVMAQGYIDTGTQCVQIPFQVGEDGDGE